MRINLLLLTEENQQLAEELHKPVVRKFEKHKVYSSFNDNIWGTDQANMQSTKNIIKKFLLCVIDNFNKYARIVPLTDKKGLQLLMLFEKN